MFLGRFEQLGSLGFGDRTIFVVLGRDDVFTLGLTFGFFLAARHIDGDGHEDFGMKTDLHVMKAKRLDGFLQINLRTGNLQFLGADRIDDVARRDRAIKVSGFAGLTDQDVGVAIDVLSQAGGRFTAFGIALFDDLTLTLEPGLVGLGRAQRLFLRQQEIAGKRASWRARLMARASSRCFFADTAVIRAGTILPRSDM